MADDEIQYERPTLHSELKTVLYLPNGTALRRPIGFGLQTTSTFPELTKTGKKKGKKR